MLFQTVTYLLFLCIAVLLYYLLGRRMRLWMLLSASIIFYGFWRFDFIPILMLSVVVDYLAAIGISKARSHAARSLLLLGSVAVNLGLLVYFKYATFLLQNLDDAFLSMGWQGISVPTDIILPMGISFYTFQSMSYTIDVYRGFIKPEKDFVLFADYVLFFPQLIAGPILRAREVLPQLSTRARFDWDNIAEGLKRIIFGLFLKACLADQIGSMVDYAFSIPAQSLRAFDVWTMSFLFGFQIYFDFSAYSHIAIGSARLMGISFPENFCFPYSATSPREFWKRWHISLSSWIRDYLYLPLCGQKVRDVSTDGIGSVSNLKEGNGRSTWALFATWMIMGLWHGSNWTFALWGLWHATLVFLGRIFPRAVAPSRIRTALGWMCTISLTMLGWIAFRAHSVGDCLALWGQIVTPGAYFNAAALTGTSSRFLGFLQLSFVLDYYLIAAALTVAVLCTEKIATRLAPTLERKMKGVLFIGHTLLYAVAFALAFIYLEDANVFVYFQF